MEDVLSVQFEKGLDGQEIEFAYFAVFDGHGGPEAAKFAKEHLLTEIKKNKGFWSDDDVQVMKAIRDGFISAHKLMWKDVGEYHAEVLQLSTKTDFRAWRDPLQSCHCEVDKLYDVVLVS